MNGSKAIPAALTGKDNRFRIDIRETGDRIRFAQRNTVTGLCLAAFGAGVWFVSAWAGTVLLALAVPALLWTRELEVDRASGTVRLRAGLRPFARTLQGGLDAVSHVSVCETRFIGTGRRDASMMSTLLNWEVRVVGFGGRLRFPVWQGTDRDRVAVVAAALGTVFDCEVRRPEAPAGAP